jgi:hypothetical protein
MIQKLIVEICNTDAACRTWLFQRQELVLESLALSVLVAPVAMAELPQRTGNNSETHSGTIGSVALLLLNNPVHKLLRCRPSGINLGDAVKPPHGISQIFLTEVKP